MQECKRTTVLCRLGVIILIRYQKRRGSAGIGHVEFTVRETDASNVPKAARLRLNHSGYMVPVSRYQNFTTALD